MASYTMFFVRQFLFRGQLVFFLQLHARSSSTCVDDGTRLLWTLMRDLMLGMQL